MSAAYLAWLAGYVLGVVALTPAIASAQVDDEPASAAQAQEKKTSSDDVARTFDGIVVLGRRQRLVGEAVSASEGVIGSTDIAERPMLRTGDLLEFVPGLIATAHSGSGKANQYFLRGFNLDHGTDFSTTVDGMPVNMRTHGHGQGYTDLNFLIPETVESLTYRKGTYYADVGDFSSAGSVQFHLAERAAGQAQLVLGGEGYGRVLALGSRPLASGELLFAGELQAYDGPWDDVDEDVSKRNLLLRYSVDAGGGRANFSLMSYRNTWNSPDQIPQRAVDQGLISEFGSLDTDLGGRTSRDSLSASWRGPAFGGDFTVAGYAIDYSLDLWSNFTYLLDDPVEGDEFEQVDERRLYGFTLSQQWRSGKSRWRVGAEGRQDDIDRVALLHTRNRQPIGTVRDDAVAEGSLGIHVANEYSFNDRWRSYLGLRRDHYRFDVDSFLPANSGDASDGITSYKASLAFQPANALELYASTGTGFHSNDARGTTIRVDPGSGDPASPVDPLVPSRGSELGARFQPGEQLHATFALWRLHLDSELLFVGDAGNTEASRPSKREGIEAGVYWYPTAVVSANLEASYTRARFDDGLGDDRIPGAIPLVIGGGLNLDLASGWQGSLQVRHFGAYPLIEDGSVEARGSTLVNLRLGHEGPRWSVYADVLNALDSRDHDVDYFYESRLPGEPDEGVEDVHFHVFPSRTLRVTLRLAFP